MEILISLAGEADESELLALRDWLMQESPRPGPAELVAAPAEPGTMGPLIDTLQVALASGGAGSVLAGSVATWLSTRRRPVSLRVKRPDGSELEISADVKNPEAAIERFLDVE
jgi:membrane-associated two-gene conflict system component 1 (EACC1)